MKRSRLAHKLARRAAYDPNALAAWIGRRKYGPKKFAKMARRGR